MAKNSDCAALLVGVVFFSFVLFFVGRHIQTTSTLLMMLFILEVLLPFTFIIWKRATWTWFLHNYFCYEKQANVPNLCENS